jgi:iron complex outermembrane receptor protein/hemoglobin/transferrin/lactoferrin receptor protein
VIVGASEVDVHLSVENLLSTAYRDFLDTQKGFTLGAGRNVALRVSVPLVFRR